MATANIIDDSTKKEGYDVEFVKDISTDEITCVICLHVLREPVQAVPCGHRFCKSCVSKVPNDGGSFMVCPIDRSSVQIFPDVGRKREILNFKVKCKNHRLSCSWTGELRELEKHMLQDCLFVCLECKNKCGKNNIPRNQMIHHLESECCKNTFTCKFAKLGCQVTANNKRLISGHLKENIEDHLGLHIEQQEETVTKLRKTITEHEEKVAKLQDTIAKQEKKITQQRTKQTKQEKKLTQQSIEIKEQRMETGQLKLKLKQHQEVQDKVVEDQRERINELSKFLTSPKGLCTFKIDNFGVKLVMSKISSEPTHLDSFYFLNGYKGRLNVYLNGNASGKDTHMSVSFQLMKGPFDDMLVWPMTFALITISLVFNGECMTKCTINCKEVEEHLNIFFAQPRLEEGGAWGFEKVISHEDIPGSIDGDAVTYVVDVTRL